MSIDEFVEELKDKTNSTKNKRLNLYPNKNLTTHEFDEMVEALKKSDTQFEFNRNKKVIIFRNFGEIYFGSADNLDDIKSLKFDEIFVHPSIKEIVL